MKRIAFVIFLGVLICSTSFAQALFPCYGGKPTAAGCPAVPGTPTNFNPVMVNNNDYYDLFVVSICVNQPDSWWRNKLVHAFVTVKTGKINQTIPVYEQRTGNGCHIGIADYPLITSVPMNGNNLTVATHIYRSDDSDGLKTVLNFMTDQQKNTTLNTYAAAAVPYLTAVGDIATKVYSAFAKHQTNFLDFKVSA